MYSQPMSEVIGVCNAKPTRSEISPSDTAAVYQFSNSSDVPTVTITTTARRRISRIRLYRVAGDGWFPVIACSMIRETARMANEIAHHNVAFLRSLRYSPKTENTFRSRMMYPARKASDITANVH